MLSVNGCVHTACAVSHMIILIIKFPNNVVLVQAVLRKYLTVCAAVAIFMDITLSIAWVIHLFVRPSGATFCRTGSLNLDCFMCLANFHKTLSE